MSLKQIYTVKSIKYDQTKEWLLHKHYAKRMPPIEYAFGLYDYYFEQSIRGLFKHPSYGLPMSPALDLSHPHQKPKKGANLIK